MTDDLSAFLNQRSACFDRPFAGLTFLVVEDSRFACEAFRLLGQRAGARIRRADCMRSARRHLQTYRPGVVIVDVGLPDGVGTELIGELAQAAVRVPAIIGTSGDPLGRDAALAAGADAFIAKPVESLTLFRNTILAVMPGLLPAGWRPLPVEDRITPDALALRDDLAEAARLLDASQGDNGARLDYLSQFLSGIARDAHDLPLERACADLARVRRDGQVTAAAFTRLSGLVAERLRHTAAF